MRAGRPDAILPAYYSDGRTWISVDLGSDLPSELVFELRDRYTCTYGCPVNADGQGICPKAMLLLFPLMEAVRSGGDLRNLDGTDRYVKDVVCSDGNVVF